MRTITLRDLEGTVKTLNQLTGNPVTSYTKTKTGCTANIGNYHLDGAYGGYDVCQMDNNGGGIHSLFRGHFSKREIYNRLWAYIEGIRDAKQQQKQD